MPLGGRHSRDDPAPGMGEHLIRAHATSFTQTVGGSHIITHSDVSVASFPRFIPCSETCFCESLIRLHDDAAATACEVAARSGGSGMNIFKFHAREISRTT